MPKAAPSRVAPPRPMNCFLLFRNDKQKEIVAKCKGANHRDISKIIAKWWDESEEEVKKYYRLKAYKEKERHQQMYPGYKYAPKRKDGPKRPYIRRTAGTIFTSKTEENNKLMEHMYNSTEEKFNAIPIADHGERSEVKPKVRKSCKYGNNSKRKARHVSPPITSNYQNSPLFHGALSPGNAFSPGSGSSGTTFKTPSPSSSFRALPYMYPTVSSYHHPISGQEQLYTTYYDPTRQTYDYVNQHYVQSLHSNNSNDVGLVLVNYSNPQYTTYPALYHISPNYVNESSGYVTTVNKDAYDYEKGADEYINPVLLGMP